MHKASGQIAADAPERLTSCLECGSETLEERCDEETFEYGGREKPFTVTARIPSLLCTTCGFRFYNEAAEQARHEAACRHLGVMTPAEIRALRKRYGSTQEAFAELTGLGVASLGRWERGEGIQNEACDALLYLSTFPENVERLKSRAHRSLEPAGTQIDVWSEHLPDWPDQAHFQLTCGGNMKGQLTRMCGVYLVAAELSRLGFIASPTSRSALGADILVTDQACQRAFSIQVKTNSGDPNFWLVGKQIPVSDTHIYVLVNLHSKKNVVQPEYFIVPSREIKVRVVHSVHPRSEFFSVYKKDNLQKKIKGVLSYRDKWDVFGDPHAEVSLEESVSS